MMAVLTFVFTKLFPNPNPQFPVFILCGLVPLNFFSIAWVTGTTSIVDSASLVKRVLLPREIVPIAAVLSCCLHLLIQVFLLLSVNLIFGNRINIQWLWLPVVWGLEIVFTCGLALITSTLNVYVRDTRYVVESINTILFWLVPVFYDFKQVPQRYSAIYQVNPVAAMVLCLRDILMKAESPRLMTLSLLAAVSVSTLIVGLLVFRQGKRTFYEYI
jgi:ABC-type polysaccharide/polyol phosphate export permease